jgi:hypothetical protein
VKTDLESDLPAVRKSAARALLSHRNVSHAHLRALAEKHIAGPKHGTAKDIILLLGKLNSTESIGWLIDHIDFNVFYKEVKRPQTWADRLPAAQALIDIGLPSIGPVLARAESDHRANFASAAAAVLIGILSERGAARRISAEIAASSAQPVKEALGKVLAAVRDQSGA